MAFVELRDLTWLARSIATHDHLAGADETSRDRFAQYVDVRDNSRTDGRYRSFLSAPTDPVLFAAGLQIAFKLYAATDHEHGHLRGVDDHSSVATMSLESAWAWFFDRLHDPRANERLWQLRRWWQPPGRHAAAMEAAWERALNRRGQGFVRAARRGAPSPRVDSRHVPARLWPEAYAAVTDGLVAQGWSRCNPRFAAVLLTRKLEPSLSSWEAAYRSLGLPTGLDRQCRNQLVGSGLYEEVDARLHLLVEALDRSARQERIIDYTARRSALAGLVRLDEADWHAVCRACGVLPDMPRARLRHPHATTWTWALLTGGDYRDAPAMADLARSYDGRRAQPTVQYKHFLVSALPRAEEPLRELATELLARHGLRGPVAWSPVIDDPRTGGIS